jgi:hypothetical protein
VPTLAPDSMIDFRAYTMTCLLFLCSRNPAAFRRLGVFYDFMTYS